MRRYVPLLIAGLALFLLGALTGRTAVAADPCGGGDPVTPPGQARHAYVLQQVSSKTELNNVYAGQIADVHAVVPAVNGFSLRMGWTQYAADTSVLDAGKAIADRNGMAFAFRFMAGRFTPAAYLDEMGSGYYYVKSNGERVPKPFGVDGTAGNPVFEAHYKAVVDELLDWSAAHGVTLLHLPWYGQEWAELNNGIEVRSSAGYSQDAWLEGHKRLIRLVAAEQTARAPGVAVEWPLSGYGPLQAVTPLLADEIATDFGADSTAAYFQANGWGPAGEWGAPSATVEQQMDANFAKPVKHGVQAIQPTTTWTEADITAMLAQANGTPSPAGSTAAHSDYFELYTPTLRGTSGARWADNIATWVAG